MIKIYMLFNPLINDSKKYIGSTTLALKTRFSQHKSDANRTTSRILFDEYGKNNIRIVLIEENDVSKRAERERFYMELHQNTVNKNIPCACDVDRSLSRKISMKKYFTSHKDKWNKYQKEYRIKNLTIINVNKLSTIGLLQEE
jgi:hypothetical protein